LRNTKERGEKVKIEVVTFGSGLIAARRHVAGKGPHRGDGAEYGGGSRPAATPIGIERLRRRAPLPLLMDEQRLAALACCLNTLAIAPDTYEARAAIVACTRNLR
jgi:hypothetical protein